MAEELWQLFSKGESVKGSAREDETESKEDLMAISENVVNGTDSGKTTKLQGFIGKHKSIMLVDLGSSHNFISTIT